MISQLHKRASRRYAVLVFLACLSLLLWRSFGDRHSKIYRTSWGSIKYFPSSFDWSKAKIYYPVDILKQLPDGEPKKLPVVQKHRTPPIRDPVTDERRENIKSAFKKSWDAYKRYAWGQDELMPLSAKGKRTFNGWGAQIVDAMDGLWIMGFKDDFHAAVQHVARIDWANTKGKPVDLFEVTIRYLGGLLAAYDLSQEPVLLHKAIELGDALYAAFDTPNRFPVRFINFNRAKTGRQQAESYMSIAASGTLCLEFTRLSQLTGDAKYYDATERIKLLFARFQNETKIPGMLTHDVDFTDETFMDSRFSLGGGADSFYEYLPKMHALLGGLDPEYEIMTVQALDAINSGLLYRPMTPTKDDILLPGSAFVMDGVKQMGFEMEHLACFAGGMYALAGKLLSRKDYIEVASRLTDGCVWLYDAFPTNIMPDNVELAPCPTRDKPCDYIKPAFADAIAQGLPEGFRKMRNGQYLLRPEAIESVYYMWRITGDTKWRDAAWRMWEGIVRYAETNLAFATVLDVNSAQKRNLDVMEVR